MSAAMLEAARMHELEAVASEKPSRLASSERQTFARRSVFPIKFVSLLA